MPVLADTMLYGSEEMKAQLCRDDLAKSWYDRELEQLMVEHAQKDDEEMIDSLDDSVVDVNDLSSAYEVLKGEAEVAAVSDSDDDDDEDEVVIVEELVEIGGKVVDISDIQIIHSTPVWATMAPLDPRSCIRTPVFPNLDSRFPIIQVPRIDLSFSANSVVMLAAGAVNVSRLEQSMSPQKEKVKITKYAHDSKTCWVCKSSKTAEQKRALHRYHEKRTRRNWKRVPRYTGRSSVASSRVRNSGRFTCATRWV
uniref:CCT domain-containing protein n=1 Tax=Hyaloperonospora arabidopsidis (strain Emoy2) TaxID=559515 RepID=M4B1U2_HYAAE